MKRIRINHVQSPAIPKSILQIQNKFRISLGNGYTFVTKSERAATEFLSRTNKFLNECVFELNSVYSRAFVDYRRIWSLLPDGNSSRINGLISNVNGAFEIVVQRSHFSNGNYFSFKHLEDICRNLKEILINLNEVLKMKFMYNDVRFNDALTREINRIERKLKDYS